MITGSLLVWLKDGKLIKKLKYVPMKNQACEFWKCFTGDMAPRKVNQTKCFD